MGSSGIISFAQKGARGLPKLAAKIRVGQKMSGGAASIAQRALASAAPAMQGMEKKWGIFGKGLATVSKPLGWATKGIDKLAGPALLEHAASARKIPVPKGFEDMSPAEQERYVNARVLSSSDRIQLAARMADKGTFKFTSKDSSGDS